MIQLGKSLAPQTQAFLPLTPPYTPTAGVSSAPHIFPFPTPQTPPATPSRTLLSLAPSPGPVKACWATLVTSPKYLQGLVVLQATLRAVGSQYPLVVMVTDSLDAASRRVIETRGMRMVHVESLRPAVTEGTAAGGGGVFTRFLDTWTKLRAFELIEWERVVLLDCDMIVMRNMDSLMSHPLPSRDHIAAVHACTCNPRKIASYPDDWTPKNCAYTPLTHPTSLTHPTPASSVSPLHPSSPPDPPRTHSLLNSGLVILHPSTHLAAQILTYISTSPDVNAFKFPDQDALAVIFRGKWGSLPWAFNALKTVRRAHEGVWRDEEVRCLHYILDKPWEHLRTDLDADETGTHEWWWAKYEDVLSEMKREEGSGWELVDRWVMR